MKDRLIPETFRWGRDLAISNGLRGKAIRERVPLGGAVSCWFDLPDSPALLPKGSQLMADLELLTPRQREIYEFIRDKIQRRGYGPTVREIGQQFDIKSPNGVMCHLKALQKKGLIHRETNMARAIQLLDDPTTPEPAGIPLRGRIAAGQPIEAVEQEEFLAVQDWQLAGDKFALQVSGDSMIEEHIADGDYVIIKQQKVARDGQIVAVADGDNEVTLKRFFKEKNRYRLEPANKNYKPIYRDHVEILGVLVGVIRKY